ncbi:hypothetical protein IEQ34_022684 [Dendrobium chrysotoxum]|uniref:Uncharacterized protein n=1 Tax=Dendrobium chrysotoxum TaxID=161865 RepID=A0AAV7FYG4_DENCH|nr:hypothetical protein IEQ34_022684 [Dendrobium chrysotoxum]
MTQTSKAWHYFTSAHILPSKNISEVSKDKAFLNFTIQKGYSIKIGKGSTSIGLGHPSLVYALCVVVRVRGDQNEEQLFSITTLTRRKILNFKQSDREEEDPSEPNTSGGARGSSKRKSARTPKSLSYQMANPRERDEEEEENEEDPDSEGMAEDFKLSASGRQPMSASTATEESFSVAALVHVMGTTMQAFHIQNA